MAAMAGMMAGSMIGGAVQTGLNYLSQKSLMEENATLQLQNWTSQMNQTHNMILQSGLPAEIQFANNMGTNGPSPLPHVAQNLGGQNFGENYFAGNLSNNVGMYAANMYMNQPLKSNSLQGNGTQSSNPGLGYNAVAGPQESNVQSNVASNLYSNWVRGPTLNPSLPNGVSTASGTDNPPMWPVMGNRNIDSGLAQSATSSLGQQIDPSVQGIETPMANMASSGAAAVVD